MIDISFIIVNYKTKEMTEDCIVSIHHNQDLKKYSFEIIVIDNDSNDGSVEYLIEKNYPNTKIIRNHTNNGFGMANNFGAEHAEGEYLILLNSDTLVEETEFHQLMETIKNHNEIGVLSSKILNADGSIQSLGFQFPSVLNEIKLNLFFWNFNAMKSIRFKNYQNRGLFPADWISGCFMIMRKKDFEAVGGFDPHIFMYAEDLDLCYRLFKRKKYSYILDETSIYHLHGQSGNKSTIKATKLFDRRKNYYYVIRKNNMVSPLGVWIIKFVFYIHAHLLVSLKKLKG